MVQGSAAAAPAPAQIFGNTAERVESRTCDTVLNACIHVRTLLMYQGHTQYSASSWVFCVRASDNQRRPCRIISSNNVSLLQDSGPITVYTRGGTLCSNNCPLNGVENQGAWFSAQAGVRYASFTSVTGCPAATNFCVNNLQRQTAWFPPA
jgi:hypothetical protein